MVLIKCIKDTLKMKIGEIAEASKASAENYVTQGYAEYYMENDEKKEKEDVEIAKHSRVSRGSRGLEENQAQINEKNEENAKKEDTLLQKSEENDSRVSRGLNDIPPTPPTTPYYDKNGGILGEGSIEQEENKLKPPTNPTNPTTIYILTSLKSHKRHIIDSFWKEADTKKKILCFIYEQELCSGDLSIFLQMDIGSIRNNFSRADQKNGLLDNNQVEISKKEGQKNYYKATNSGKAFIDDLLRKEEEQWKEYERQKQISDDNKSKEEAIMDFLRMNEVQCLEAKRKKQPYYIDFYNLIKKMVGKDVLADYLLDEPEEALQWFSLCFYSLYEYRPNVRITNLPQSCSVSIGDARISDLNKFIKVKGVPVGVSKVLPKVTSAKFECPSCGMVVNILQTGEKFKTPTVCGCGRKGKFKEITQKHTLVDVQILKLEESAEDMGKRVKPQQLTVVLQEDLTKVDIQHNLEESKKLIINGILQPFIREKGRDVLTTYDLRLVANSIELEVPEEQPLTPQEIEQAKELSKDKEIVPKIVNSFCPEIVGRNEEKEAMILSAISGSANYNKGFRDDSHLLIVGEPSIGKSFLMRRMKDIIYGSRWVSGNSTTGIGLIGSVKRDEQLGEVILSKGVLPMANHGLVLIDEFDKMRKDERLALHEPMENQSVHIDKWDKHAEFRTDCTIIASLNPKYSRFTDGNIIEQIDLPPSLLSRFDLIMVMRDKVDEKSDGMVVDAIAKRFKSQKQEEKIDLSVIRKYLNYARTIEVELNDETVKYIKKYYTKIRSRVGLNIGIASRQLEGLFRLATASAKLRLAPKTNEEDADRAIRLLNYSLKNISTDELTGGVDVDIIHAGISGSQRAILDFIRQRKKIQYGDLLSAFTIPPEQMDKIIENFKKRGDVFENKPGELSYNG